MTDTEDAEVLISHLKRAVYLHENSKAMEDMVYAVSYVLKASAKTQLESITKEIEKINQRITALESNIKEKDLK